MKFRPVYYMISGWPSLEKTREMVRRYVEHGVTALQFDMPGADPSRESAFIQQGMRHALKKFVDYTKCQQVNELRKAENRSHYFEEVSL